jgi:hypothetical protein
MDGPCPAAEGKWKKNRCIAPDARGLVDPGTAMFPPSTASRKMYSITFSGRQFSDQDDTCVDVSGKAA